MKYNEKRSGSEFRVFGMRNIRRTINAALINQELFMLGNCNVCLPYSIKADNREFLRTWHFIMEYYECFSDHAAYI